MSPASEGSVAWEGALRPVLTAVAALVLAVVAGWCLVRGVEVVSSTGGLLTRPVPLTRLSGPWLLAGTVAGTAAVLVGLEAAATLTAARRARSGG